MSNFFLLNESIALESLDLFTSGMSKLVSIDKETDDIFLRHESIWKLDILVELFSNFGPTEQVISKFIEQMRPSDINFKNEKEFDEAFEYMLNAFLGVDFLKTTIQANKQIIDDPSYKKFNFDNLWKVTFRNLWSRKEKLFPSLCLCGEVENQLLKIGNSSHFNQIVERLKEFNNAVSAWDSGNFNYNQINQNYALNISPESAKTMSKYGSERLFSIPNGGTQSFELHIKTGDLRFHFYPDNGIRKVFIGYIGPHLSTISN